MMMEGNDNNNDWCWMWMLVCLCTVACCDDGWWMKFWWWCGRWIVVRNVCEKEKSELSFFDELTSQVDASSVSLLTSIFGRTTALFNDRIKANLPCGLFRIAQNDSSPMHDVEDERQWNGCQHGYYYYYYYLLEY